MIFNSNNTSLGSSIAMAEGYDGSMGCALALIESARNEHAMFLEMLKVEAKSMSGLNESQLISLQEATGAGIIAKIKELLKKLIAKVKSIFTTFMSKINSIFMSDKQMVKKYRQLINRKGSLSKMEVKWAKISEFGKKELAGSDRYEYVAADLKKCVDSAGKKDEPTSDRVERYLSSYIGESSTDAGSFEKDYHEKCFDDMEKMELGDTGEGIVGIMNYLETGEKTISTIKANNTRFESAVTKMIKLADDDLKAEAKKTGDDFKQDDLDKAKVFYDEACAYQTASLKYINCNLQAYKFKHAMFKAAFMKAVAVNDKKLNENAEYLDALTEAVTDEVDGVFDSFLNKETISDLSAASTDLFANGRTDDPDAITKGSFDSYKSVSEGADFFGTVLY